MSENNLTHFDAAGNAVMVDVSAKPVTTREATAHGIITMNAEAFAAVQSGTVKKGDVLGVARIAGIMATKRTSELIPLCHPLPLTKAGIEFRLLPERQAVEALCTVKTSGVTGVEMEALTGVSTALLTIYDMCKAVDKGMELGEIHVGDEVTLLPALENPPLRAAVITLSDKGSRGEREDKSGPLIAQMLTAAGYVVEETMILPDEAKALKAQLIRLADGRQVNLILTTGGTGFSPRDITPEATCAVADRNAPGIAEAMRYHSLSITPRGMLSRGVSVLRGKTLIVNLPGSPKAVQENLEYILPSLEHGVRIAAGLDGECARK